MTRMKHSQGKATEDPPSDWETGDADPIQPYYRGLAGRGQGAGVPTQRDFGTIPWGRKYYSDLRNGSMKPWLIAQATAWDRLETPSR